MNIPLSFFLISSFVFNPLGRTQTGARNLSRVSVLALQSAQIKQRLLKAYAVYTVAKNAYAKSGPQAFVKAFAAPASLSAVDQTSFVTLFKGLPKLPEMQIGVRGFELSDKRAGYVVRVEVLDIDQRIFDVNGETIYIGANDSFEDISNKVGAIIQRGAPSASLLNRGLHYIMPEAHAFAFLIPLLAGGVVAAIVKMFGKKADTKASDKTQYAEEPGAGADAIGNHGAARLPPAANPDLGKEKEVEEENEKEKEVEEEKEKEKEKEKDHLPKEEPTTPPEDQPAAEQKAAPSARATDEKSPLCEGDKANSEAVAIATQVWQANHAGVNRFTPVADVKFLDSDADDGKNIFAAKLDDKFLVMANPNGTFSVIEDEKPLCEGRVDHDIYEKVAKELSKDYCTDDAEVTVKGQEIAQALWHKKYGTEAQKTAAQTYLQTNITSDVVHEDPYHIHPNAIAEGVAIFIDRDQKLIIKFNGDPICVAKLSAPEPAPTPASAPPAAQKLPVEKQINRLIFLETIKTELNRVKSSIQGQIGKLRAYQEQRKAKKANYEAGISYELGLKALVDHKETLVDLRNANSVKYNATKNAKVTAEKELNAKYYKAGTELNEMIKALDTAIVEFKKPN